MTTKDFINKVICGDCIEIMKDIPNKSIDMILCDLPYNTTACHWDVLIPFEPLWEQYKRIIKDNGAIVLTASQPFTSALVMSNIKMFKYELIWDKVQGKQPFLAKIQPMKSHENILLFSKGKMTYNPQMWKGKAYTDKRAGQLDNTTHWVGHKRMDYENKSDRYPITVIKANNPNRAGQHPTQKPVALFEYLIKTYTSVGDVVLDNTIGSGTTAVAAINTGRNFIGIEMDKGYCDIANKRIQEAREKLASKLPL
jgi:site-specific DNA-methyltransferase (adenine-specific)